jgi:peptidoglycan/LPS O-acetylase OafA/YrhL
MGRIVFSQKDILANITMLQGFTHIADINPVFWTLQIELIFYFLCVVLSIAGQLEKTKILTCCAALSLALAALLAVMRYVLVIKLPVAVPLALFLMFTGAIIRQAVLDRNIQATSHLTGLLAVFFAVLPAICLLAYNHDFGFNEKWYQYWTSYTLAVAVFMLGITSCRLTGRVMVFLGTISYSVYLLHPVVWQAFEAIGVTPQVLHPDLIILVFGVATLAVSTFTYMCIEKPAIALGRAVIRRL